MLVDILERILLRGGGGLNFGSELSLGALARSSAINGDSINNFRPGISQGAPSN